MGLVAKVKDIKGVSFDLKIVKRQVGGILEFYLEASYGEGGKIQDYLCGGIAVNERGIPVLREPLDDLKDYDSIAKNLVPDSSIDASVVPKLLASLKERIEKMKQGGAKVQKVGNYTLEQVEALYS